MVHNCSWEGPNSEYAEEVLRIKAKEWGKMFMKYYYQGDAPDVTEEEGMTKTCLVRTEDGKNGWCDACQEWHSLKEAYDYTEKALDVTEEVCNCTSRCYKKYTDSFYRGICKEEEKAPYTSILDDPDYETIVDSSNPDKWKFTIKLKEKEDMKSEDYKRMMKEMTDKSPSTLVNDDQNALDTQVGGDHYKECGIQPVEYIAANDLNYFEGNIVKYVTRHRRKGAGREDIEKVIHYAQLMLELEYGDE